MRLSLTPWLVLAVLGVLGTLTPTTTRAQERCEDAELSELAAIHAIEHVGPTELLARARRGGASHPSLHLVVLADDDLAGRARFLAALEARGLGPLLCGEALTETSRVVVAAPRQGSLAIEGSALRVTLTPGFAEPVVYIRAGTDEPRAYAVREGVAQVDLATIEAPARIQLVATGSEGPRPVAELDVGDGIVEPSLPADPSVVTVLRARAGAGPLRPNRLLREVAEAHAEEVCRSGHVAHEIADEGDAEERLRRAHVEARHVGEVVARAQSVEGAWRALAASPSHRAALGDRRFTDAGIASVERDAHTCVVVVLASWPRRTAR